MLLAGRADRRAAGRARDAPGGPDEGRREGRARLVRGQAVGLRPEGRPRAAARVRSARSPTRSRQRVHALACRADARPSRVKVRAIASLFQTNLEVERDGDRLQELFAFYAGLGLPVYLGQLGLPGTDEDFLAMGRELEGKSCASPVGTTAAEWQIAGPQELELGREEPGHPRRQGARPRAARGAGREGARPADPGAARAADRGRRPLLHDAAPLVDAGRLRADRDRDLRAREPERGVPPVPGRRPHLDARRRPLLRGPAGVEAAAGAARGDQPDRRGPRELPRASAAASRRPARAC